MWICLKNGVGDQREGDSMSRPEGMSARPQSKRLFMKSIVLGSKSFSYQRWRFTCYVLQDHNSNIKNAKTDYKISFSWIDFRLVGNTCDVLMAELQLTKDPPRAYGRHRGVTVWPLPPIGQAPYVALVEIKLGGSIKSVGTVVLAVVVRGICYYEILVEVKTINAADYLKFPKDLMDRWNGNQHAVRLLWQRQAQSSYFNNLLNLTKEYSTLTSTGLLFRPKSVWLRSFPWPKKGSWWVSVSH